MAPSPSYPIEEPDLESTPVLEDLAKEARRLRNEYLGLRCEEARQKIYHRIVNNISAEQTHNVSEAMRSLQRICKLEKPCILPKADKPGAYITWVPMYGYNRVKELDRPYMPYFGDDGLDKAQELYESMCKDFGPQSAFELPSDGEISEQNSTPRRKSRNRELSNDLGSIRLREAQRHSILIVIQRYGDHEYVWKALSQGLGMRDVARIKAVHDVAFRRSTEMKENTRRRGRRELLTTEIKTALGSPPSVEDYPPPFIRGSRVSEQASAGHYVAACKYFCFVCWTFACRIHNPKETVEPLKPIPDLNTDNRMDLLDNKAAKPCSQRCFLLQEWLQLSTEVHEYDNWTAEEEWLLREAVPIFRNDPCSLAVAIGSRSCRAVRKKVEPPEYQRWIEETVRSENKSRPSAPNVYYREQLKKAQKGFAAEKQLERKNSKKNGKKKSARARKSCNSNAEPAIITEHPRFIPCNHPGPCVEGEKNCTCVLKNTHCQSRCGCNGARLTEGATGEIGWKGKDCGRGARGCSCKEGNCLGDKCVCAGDMVACSPDICKCDCRKLQWDPNARKCRNVDAIHPLHKRTFIGKSKYNLGLFAGDHFKKGDLVGVYFGNVLGEELIEKAIRVGQEMNHTYALDLTDDLTIDALQMGSKVRFVNHANSAEQGANCECKFVSIRGDPRAILRTTRPVKPGEEFFFDYKLTHSEGNDWLWKGKGKNGSA